MFKEIYIRMRITSVIARQALLNAMVFRANYFISLVVDILIVLLSIELWRAIYTQGDQSVGIQITKLVTYLTLARVITPIDMEFVGQMQQKVLTGEIANELLRPLSLSSYMLAQEIGRYVHRIVFNTLPVILVSALVVKLDYPDSATTIAIFIVSVALSFFLMFWMNYITALMAFWITQLFSLNVIKGQTVRFLSGTFVPLWFFPQSINSLMKLLPFASVVFTPIVIFLEENGNRIRDFQYIGLQILWLVITYGIARYVWSKVVKRISVNGG